MRIAVLVVLGSLGACFQASGKRLDALADDGSGSGGIGNGAPFCDLDADCALAAATCCACPSFAVAASDNTFEASCKDVACPMPASCSPMVASCVAHACTAVCAPVACDASCTDGYALDGAGCLTCACAAPDGGCVGDTDCTEVAADCCGCARGGSDTAVPNGDVASFEAALGCSSNANCPETNTCESAATARCVQGRCALTATKGLPAGSCGRPDLPTCPTGQHCILNASPEATALGVGICGMP